ncbi:MAG: hypothetical protein HZC29_00840 [Thaumarchaeota archaeon]|nr:hypothetical protein [Nitrososphaerota archaeon]
MNLAVEIRNEIAAVQEQVSGDERLHNVWMSLQKIWSKLKTVEVIECETVATINKKIIELLQEKESLEETFYLTNGQPNQRYKDVCAELKLLQVLVPKN